MVFKFELEAALVKRLGLSEQPLLLDVVKSMRGLKIAEPDIDKMRDLLLKLSDLHERQDQTSALPVVNSQMFRNMVAEGNRILSLLEVKTKQIK